MRSTLTFTVGLVCLIDIGMICFMNNSWLAKIGLLPVIGTTLIIALIAGHYIDEKKLLSAGLMLVSLVACFLIIFGLVTAPMLEKKIIFSIITLASLLCLFFGYANERYNRWLEKN